MLYCIIWNHIVLYNTVFIIPSRISSAAQAYTIPLFQAHRGQPFSLSSCTAQYKTIHLYIAHTRPLKDIRKRLSYYVAWLATTCCYLWRGIILLGCISSLGYTKKPPGGMMAFNSSWNDMRHPESMTTRRFQWKVCTTSDWISTKK